MPSTEPWRNPRPAPNLDEVRQRVPLSSSRKPWLRAWWPALVWAIVIFFASTDSFSSDHTAGLIEPIVRWFYPYISLEKLELAHHLIRKAAHLTEYFIFFLLLYRGMRVNRLGWRWSWAFTAWLIAAAYSCLDEFHQSFVASRTASPWDSLLDSTGALLALLVLYLTYGFSRRARSQ